MLWAVRNKWHSGALFSFKFYLHWATLMIRSGNGTVHFHHRKEGVIQGVPLDLIACGLVIPPPYPGPWDGPTKNCSAMV